MSQLRTHDEFGTPREAAARPQTRDDVVERHGPGLDGLDLPPVDVAPAARAPQSPPEVVLALQRRAGNRAAAEWVQRNARSPRGEPLPVTADGAHRVLGEAATAVRVHRDSPIAENPDALARTEGFDIHLAPGAPGPETTGGQVILAHEAAHVVQQTRPGPRVQRAAAEREADEAAEAALDGGPVPDLKSARGPHYFEARWHQATLTNAMELAGFSDEEQQEAYFANWCRDVSQLMVPPARKYLGPQNIMTLLNVMAQMKFGRGVTPEDLGQYSRREHIDAPAGTTNDDVIGKALKIEGRGRLPLEGGPEHKGSPTESEDLSSANIANLMRLDASGTPAYIYSSKDYILEQARAALAAGRTPTGLAHLGNLSHTVQDLFAHSNWVEMAVGKLIEEDKVVLDLAGPGPEAEAAREVKRRRDAGLPAIETYAGEVQTAAGDTRPILTTGTFSGSLGDPGHDTLISIRHEARNFLDQHNPFAPGGSDTAYFDLAIELLRRAETSAQEGSLGEIVIQSVEAIASNAAITRRVEDVAHDLERGARSLGGAGRLGDILAGGARLVGGAAQSAVGWAGDAWKDGLRRAATTIVNRVLGNATLVDVAEFVLKGRGAIGTAWNGVKQFVEGLPDRVRDIIMPQLVKAEEALKKKYRQLGQAAWQTAVGKFMEALGEVAPHAAERESPVFKKVERLRNEVLPKLREDMANAIRRVSSGPEAERAIALIEKRPLGEIIPYLQGAGFQQLLRGLDRVEQRRLMETGENFSELNERIQQFDNLPEWAKPGPSHSQLAKDHASSPFFGAAFAAANQADTLLVQALQQAWAARGQTGPAAGLGGDVGELREERERPGEPAVERAEEREGESDLARQRRTHFLQTRQAGQRVLAMGHGEIALPVQALVEAADALWNLQTQRPVVGPVVRGLVALLREAAPSAQLLAEIARVRRWLQTQGDDELTRLLSGDLSRIEQIVRSSLTPDCEPGETSAQHNVHAGMHQPGETPERHAQHAGVCTPGETAADHAAHAASVHPGETLVQHAAHAGTPAGETPAQHMAHAGPPCPGETPEQHTAHTHAPVTPAHYREQIDQVNRFRGPSREIVLPDGKRAQAGAVRLSDCDPSKGPEQRGSCQSMGADEVARRDALTEAEGDPARRLEMQIDRIFGHPYDSTWWRGTLTNWANEHKAVLARYILERNSGQIESHAH
ncbi:MAG: DUF4157 domain-containing protein [Actinobacteria bacterium]|nr:DUF4157 domain-containing protein [Actinomycetota bacterium]